MNMWRNICLWFIIWSWYQEIEACYSCGACLQPPAFISNFTTMRAQSITEATLTIAHGLGEVPVKVEVQVRPSPGRPDTEYVFPGIGSAQADDDFPQTYGGVVYKYNAQYVVLAVPTKSNNEPFGTTIYTGDNIWIGPKLQKEQTAEVRVKVWNNCTFPVPDFESSWISITSENVADSYKEVEHGLGIGPEYVSVQVKDSNSDWYSDGIGSSMKRPTSSLHWGGVLYGENDTHVRIWVPHTNSVCFIRGSSQVKGYLFPIDIGNIAIINNGIYRLLKATEGKIFSVSDGWGFEEQWSSGLIKVRVWGTFGGSLVYKSTTSVNSGLRVTEHELSTPYLDIDSGMIDVKIRATGGSNNGYYFPATGTVQNSQPNESYGGVVYSYSENGVRFWHPHLARVGSIQQNYLVYIDSSWGGGLNSQASTAGDLVVTFWNSSLYSATSTTTTGSSTTKNTTNTSTRKELGGGGGGVTKLALGLIIAASLITATGCGIAGYFGVRKIKNEKKNKISTGTFQYGPRLT